MTNRIQQVFAQAQSENRACFVAYLCAGDPDWKTSLEACRTVIENGVDILEIGVPFSDPLADGLTNQLAAERALGSGINGDQVFELVREIRKFSEVPIVFYTYYNLVFARGEQGYAEEAKAAGVDGMLVLDLPPEEARSWLEVCENVGLQTVFIIAPTTPEERVPKITGVTTGFIYYVSRTGVTGERATLPEDLAESVARIKSKTELPVVVGFGISNAEHVRAVAAIAEGVVVGSSLVNCIAHNVGEPAKILSQLTDKMQHLVSGLA